MPQNKVTKTLSKQLFSTSAVRNLLFDILRFSFIMAPKPKTLGDDYLVVEEASASGAYYKKGKFYYQITKNRPELIQINNNILNIFYKNSVI